MGQGDTVNHSKSNYYRYIVKVTIGLLLFFGSHLEAADPARKLCLDNQFIVVHADGNTTCEDCGPCPPGQQHSHVCGGHIYPNASLVCELCPENTFSSHEDTSRCVPCSSCAEGQVVLHSCTKTQDVVCEKKCSGRNSYFDESGFCLPCSKCCGDGNDKVEDECKSKLGAASENVCTFNQSRNLCDIESTTPTVATTKSAEVTQNTTSILNVTGSPTLTSKRSFAITSVSKQSTSGHSERIVSIVWPVFVPLVSVTFFLYLAASIRKVLRTRRKCNQLHRVIRDVEAGILEAGTENIPMTEMRKNTETAVLVEPGRAVGSREDVAQEILEEEEEQKKGSNEPLLGKLEPGVQRKCPEERLSKANKELVAAEELGRISGLLDEESDQEEYDVDEREESKGEEGEEEEDDDDDDDYDERQEHEKPTQTTYSSHRKQKTTVKVSKPLEYLVNDPSNFLDKICKRLDTFTAGLGNYEDVAKHYGYDVYTRSRFKAYPDGPSNALISAIIAEFPDVTVESFARVVVKQTRRKNVARLLREFDRK
ncbi:uncharacterized protein [Acropora muricata]|uniref:uncharacterized protein n=1 Tax=Acropora muricata TaxID=159855 RepID=UPI0034E3BA37